MSKAALAILVGAMGFNVLVDLVAHHPPARTVGWEAAR